MAWYDVVLGVATGGLYNIGKAAYEAGEAADAAGDAADKAGVAIATLGSTVEEVGEELVSLLNEAEELLAIDRLTPRDESELWDAEKERLDDLRDRKAQIEDELAELGVSEPGSFTFDFMDFMTDMGNLMKKIGLIGRLVAINKQIHDILYQEPGVLATGIYNAKEVLERFNTIEQPMVEEVLGSVDENLQVSEEVLQEVKKLFVTTKKIPLLEADLSVAQKDKLEMLEIDRGFYADQIGMNSTISRQFLDAMQAMPVKDISITAGSIHLVDSVMDVADSGVSVDSNVAVDSDIGAVERPSRNTARAEDTDTGRFDRFTHIAREERNTERGTDGDAESNTERRIADKKIASRDITYRSAERHANTSTRPNVSVAHDRVREDIAAMGISSRMTPSRTLQPAGAMISAQLNTKLDGYQRAYSSYMGKNAFSEWQIGRIDRVADKLKFRVEETPGVIPEILDECKDVLERVRTEEQPRIDTVLDTLNENLEESKETLERVNSSLASVQGMFSFVENNSGLVKIGLAAVGGVVFLDLLVGLFVLIRMALGF
ncbi:MAG: hypothetical protein U9N13_07130 [Euryarchaeota archaeon]|nr:hypothetical protein [Euryarchaeota archaeon]